jgi:T-complex protein 1 subunit alpha
LQDATELVAKLRAFHHTAQSSPDKRNLGQCGLDLINGEVVNNVEAGVLEPALSKTKMIQVRRALLLCGSHRVMCLLCLPQ